MPTELTWTDWPARRRPAAAAFAALAVMVAVAGIAPMDPWLAGLAAMVLLAATAEVLLPTRYTLSSAGVRADNPLSRKHRAWSDLSAWRPAPEGYWLVGRGSRPFLARRRSVRLRGPVSPQQVEALLLERLGESQ